MLMLASGEKPPVDYLVHPFLPLKFCGSTPGVLHCQQFNPRGLFSRLGWGQRRPPLPWRLRPRVGAQQRQRRHPTRRERMGSATVQRLRDPISLASVWGLSSDGFPNPCVRWVNTTPAEVLIECRTPIETGGGCGPFCRTWPWRASPC
jgi:hypothetical protein